MVPTHILSFRTIKTSCNSFLKCVKLKIFSRKSLATHTQLVESTKSKEKSGVNCNHFKNIRTNNILIDSLTKFIDEHLIINKKTFPSIKRQQKILKILGLLSTIDSTDMFTISPSPVMPIILRKQCIFGIRNIYSNKKFKIIGENIQELQMRSMSSDKANGNLVIKTQPNALSDFVKRNLTDSIILNVTVNIPLSELEVKKQETFKCSAGVDNIASPNAVENIHPKNKTEQITIAEASTPKQPTATEESIGKRIKNDHLEVKTSSNIMKKKSKTNKLELDKNPIRLKINKDIKKTVIAYSSSKSLKKIDRNTVIFQNNSGNENMKPFLYRMQTNKKSLMAGDMGPDLIANKRELSNFEKKLDNDSTENNKKQENVSSNIIKKHEGIVYDSKLLDKDKNPYTPISNKQSSSNDINFVGETKKKGSEKYGFKYQNCSQKTQSTESIKQTVNDDNVTKSKTFTYSPVKKNNKDEKQEYSIDDKEKSKVKKEALKYVFGIDNNPENIEESQITDWRTVCTNISPPEEMMCGLEDMEIKKSTRSNKLTVDLYSNPTFESIKTLPEPIKINKNSEENENEEIIKRINTCIKTENRQAVKIENKTNLPSAAAKLNQYIKSENKKKPVMTENRLLKNKNKTQKQNILKTVQTQGKIMINESVKTKDKSKSGRLTIHKSQENHSNKSSFIKRLINNQKTGKAEDKKFNDAENNNTTDINDEHMNWVKSFSEEIKSPLKDSITNKIQNVKEKFNGVNQHATSVTYPMNNALNISSSSYKMTQTNRNGRFTRDELIAMKTAEFCKVLLELVKLFSAAAIKEIEGANRNKNKHSQKSR